MKSRRNFLKSAFLIAPVFILPKISIELLSADLPKILIIGDSISIGYTPFVQQLFATRATVLRPTLKNGKPENCAGTTKGIKNIERWIGNGKWDLIHFNFGLHDIKHVDPKTGENSTNPQHPQQADLKQYKKNLEEIVKKLKATGAKLIFATTTPYPENTSGPLRSPEMPAKYNRVAIKIMNKNNILINDLYAFVIPRMDEIQKPNNVHFTEMGSLELAKKVVERIEEIL